MSGKAKILIFGDDAAQAKALAQTMRDDGLTAQCRSISHFQGDYEPADEVYMLEPADHIADVYLERGIPVLAAYQPAEPAGDDGTDHGPDDHGADGDDVHGEPEGDVFADSFADALAGDGETDAAADAGDHRQDDPVIEPAAPRRARRRNG